MALIACIAAKPGLLGAGLAYSIPSAPLITASSHQVVARTYNGLAHAPLVAVPKVVSPLAVAPVTRFAHTYATAPYYAAPLGYSAPYAAKYIASPYPTKYVAAPYVGSYPAPLHYSNLW